MQTSTLCQVVLYKWLLILREHIFYLHDIDIIIEKWLFLYHNFVLSVKTVTVFSSKTCCDSAML